MEATVMARIKRWDLRCVMLSRTGMAAAWSIGLRRSGYATGCGGVAPLATSSSVVSAVQENMLRIDLGKQSGKKAGQRKRVCVQTKWEKEERKKTQPKV
jgi:hypothetical protein